MALWSSLLLEYWKRAEKTYSLRWGMIGYEESEQIRPQYKGTQTKSPIDGKPALHFSKYERTKRAMLSGVTIMGFTIVVIGVIAAIFAIRVALTVANIMIGKQQVGNVVSSILIALQVQIMNKAFSDLAIRLNDHENHRTGIEVLDKYFIFCDKWYFLQLLN